MGDVRAMPALRTSSIALGLLACTLLVAMLVAPMAHAWADDSGDEICGYAYLVHSEDGSDLFTLVIQKDQREEAGGYRYLGPVFSDIDNRERPWDAVSSVIGQVSVQGGVKPVTTTLWLTRFENLREVDLSGLDASDITSTRHMFAYCDSLRTVDLSGLDFSSVIEMTGMFRDCPSLESVNMSGLRLPDLTDVDYMFASCPLLTSVNFSEMNTPNLSNFYKMFLSCTSLEICDLSGLGLSADGAPRVCDVQEMFRECSALKSVKLPTCDGVLTLKAPGMFAYCASITEIEFPTGTVDLDATALSGVFYGCHSLRTLDLSNVGITGEVTPDSWSHTEFGPSSTFSDCTLKRIALSNRFTSREVLTGLFTSGVTWRSDYENANLCSSAQEMLDQINRAKEAVVFEVESDSSDGVFACASTDGKTLKLRSAPRDLEEDEKLIGFAQGNSVPWKADKPSIEKIVIEDDMTYESGSDWFRGCSALVEIEGLSNLNMSDAYDLSYMFSDCRSLASVDLAGLKAHYLTNVSGMFCNCKQLTEVDLTDFNAPSVTRMSSMFLGCESLSSLDVSRWTTPRVTDMSYMFYGCKSLKSICVDGFDMSHVTDMSHMFHDCESLRSFDFTHLDTSSATDMSYLFCNCSSLTALSADGLNTSKVRSMFRMFSGCKLLPSLSLSGVDTSQVTSMSHMFFGCTSLASLDLSGLNTSNVTNMSNLFYGCTSLASLDVTGFDTSRVGNMSSMFSGCRSLETLDVSKFNTSNVFCMLYMFRDCCSLSSLDVASFDTSRVSSMAYMFENCRSLTNLDLSRFAIVNERVYLQRMLSGCDNLEHVALSADMMAVPWLPYGMWKAENAETLFRYDAIPSQVAATYRRAQSDAVLYAVLSSVGHLSVGIQVPEISAGEELYYLPEKGCAAADIPWLDRRAEVRSISVEDGVCPQSTAHWFEGCAALESADLSGLDSSWTTDFSGMFYGCSSLAELNLSSIDTRKATSMKRMFHGCRSLERIALGASFTFHGAAWSRLAGSELPTGAWQEVAPDGSPLDASRAWASDSLPSFTAATYARVDESTYVRDDGESGLTVVSVHGDTAGAENRYTIETTYVQDGEGGEIISESSYELDEDYNENVPLVIGGSAKAASVSYTTISNASVTRQKLKKVSGKVKTIVLGPSVASVGPRAFASAPSVINLRVESNRLNSKSKVLSCLYGSKIGEPTYKIGLDAKVRTAFKKYAKVKP